MFVGPNPKPNPRVRLTVRRERVAGIQDDRLVLNGRTVTFVIMTDVARGRCGDSSDR